MEAVILENLQRNYPTIEKQQARLMELVAILGNLEGEIKDTTADILCLAKLLYEGGDTKIVRNLQIQILQLENENEENEAYMQNLEDLNACLTGFKPSIFRNIQKYFSELHGVDPELITCLPKISGQQTGAEVEIKIFPEDTKPMHFYVKTHQEFCSKSGIVQFWVT
jgi:hypothetical protein